MANKTTDTVAETTPTVYQINFPQRKWWNRDNGEWEPVPLYSTPAWVKYHEKLRIVDGEGRTPDIGIALELIDMGAVVTPDPRPVWQEQHARELEAESTGNMLRLQELAKYVNETNEWRKEHGVKPLSVIAPDVPRAVSALLQTVTQLG